VSSETLNSVLRDSQTFASRKADFRDVTGHSVLRYGQNLRTSQRVPTTYNTNRAILLRAQPVIGLAPGITCVTDRRTTFCDVTDLVCSLFVHRTQAIV